MKDFSPLSALSMICAFLLLVSCGGGVKTDEKPIDIHELTKDKPETHGTEIKDAELVLEDKLNVEWIKSGKSIYEVKCQSCHKLTDERIVGPGWQDVTIRRKPLWIMNMITNVDMMLETDEEAQKLLEQCMVRMPNQNISKDEARQLLEFMRSNDQESKSK